MAFIDTIIEMRNGGVAIELEEHLEDVVQAVRATGKKGKIILTLTITPADKGPDIDTIFMEDHIKAEVPKPDKKRTLFFANENNQLTRNDTRQMSMLDGLKDVTVDVTKTNLREAK